MLFMLVAPLHSIVSGRSMNRSADRSDSSDQQIVLTEASLSFNSRDAKEGR